MTWNDQLPDYWEAFVRLYYPSYCGGCHAFLGLDEKVLCQTCHSKLLTHCFPPEEAGFHETFESLDEAWGVFAYDSPVKELITGIKFQKKRWLIRAFSEQVREMAVMIQSENHYDAILPIPLSKLTLIRREFNQAELIADHIGKATGVPVIKNLLHKCSHTIAQSQLSQKERWINPWGIFAVAAKREIRDRSFLLTDDIITTGATAEEAARILKQHGAKRVDLLALARTPRTS
jgi:ComF family protein